MFGIPGKAAVTLTPAATRQIAQLMQRQTSQGLRIGVKKGGCAGMEYTMDYVQDVNPLDEVVEHMIKKHVHRLFIKEPSTERLVGVITTFDILKIFAETLKPAKIRKRAVSIA